MSLKAQIKSAHIDNPNYDRNHAGASGNPRKIPVQVNSMESPILQWYHHSKSIDEHQFRAASQFRLYWENTGGTGARAIDYATERVDTSTRGDPIPIRVVDAVRQINRSRAILGEIRFNLIEQTCGQGIFLNQIHPHWRGQRKAMEEIKAGLNDLAAEYGFTTRVKR